MFENENKNDSLPMPDDFIEDSFDLEDFQKETMRQRLIRYQKKYQPIFNVLSFLIMLASLSVGLLVYKIMNYYIGIWLKY